MDLWETYLHPQQAAWGQAVGGMVRHCAATRASQKGEGAAWISLRAIRLEELQPKQRGTLCTYHSSALFNTLSDMP
jgi:hypothetical protein